MKFIDILKDTNKKMDSFISSYDNLQSNYNNLQSSYDSFKLNYDNFQTNYEEKKTGLEEIYNQKAESLSNHTTQLIETKLNPSADDLMPKTTSNPDGTLVLLNSDGELVNSGCSVMVAAYAYISSSGVLNSFKGGVISSRRSSTGVYVIELDKPYENYSVTPAIPGIRNVHAAFDTYPYVSGDSYFLQVRLYKSNYSHTFYSHSFYLQAFM